MNTKQFGRDSSSSRQVSELGMGILPKLREGRTYCDVLFVGENGSEFYSHKCILAAVTAVFDGCYRFKAESNRETGEIERVDLEKLDVKGSVFKIILDIIYETKPVITFDEAVDVLFDANKLLMHAVASYAEDYIVTVDSTSLSRNHQQLAKLCNFPGLRDSKKLLDYVKTHLHHNFLEVSQLPEFYRISVEVLCCLDVLKKSDLFLSGTACVDFIGKWISYDLNKRIADMKEMIEYLTCSANRDSMNNSFKKFSSAFDDICKNKNDPDTIITLFRFGLHGLLWELVSENFPLSDAQLGRPSWSLPVSKKYVTISFITIIVLSLLLITIRFIGNGIICMVILCSSGISGRYYKCPSCKSERRLTNRNVNCTNTLQYLDWFHCNKNVNT